jgi:predicted DNA-binding transcriptional regulator AlpA
VSERLLTAREFAGRLGVSIGALLRWTRAGQVPGAVKLPSGAIRYRPELIEPWLDELAIGADGASREVSPTRNAGRPGGAYEEGYFDSSPTALHDAARDEEDDHAS